MLVFILIFSIIIVGTIVCICDISKWETDIAAVVGFILLVSGVIAALTCGIMIIHDNVYWPSRQVAYEQKYEQLLYQKEHIDDYNYDEVVNRIGMWNTKYREEQYAQDSLWVNQFHTYDLSKVDLIELPEQEV